MSDDTAEQMARHMRRVFPNHRPILTMLGVDRLRQQGMKVEIEAVASL
jgi:enamine deaminase RidA (YjgF/YER057c/UK114 family)